MSRKTPTPRSSVVLGAETAATGTPGGLAVTFTVEGDPIPQPRPRVYRNGRRVYAAIECDGREFHSHPDDVARDKTRDRDLAASGWLVCRFTGSEIASWGTAGNVLLWRFLASLAGVWCRDDRELLADVPAPTPTETPRPTP